ncbi:MAG: transposase [Gemmataceae bacterium]
MSAWAIEDEPMADSETLAGRVERFFAPFELAFRRRDQARWAKVYLQGLVEVPGRKTVENLARAAALPDGFRREDAAQALGHFVNQSPWEEDALWGRYHAWLAGRVGKGGVFILEEFPIEKQGRHSVGVQRQLSRALGRKTNCQLGVTLYHAGPAGCYPLAIRLYLPRGWLEEVRLSAAGVPEAARQGKTKLEIGLEWIAAARQAGLAATELVAGVGWPPGEELSEAARENGLTYSDTLPSSVAACREAMLERLGLGHFEGRSWRGFHHHACLVTLAAAFLAESEG